MNDKTYIVTNKKYTIIKVGTSKNPYKHLKTLQKSTNPELELVCVFEGDIRKEIKELLKKYKILGDWYYPEPKTLLEIQEKFLPNNQELASFIYTTYGEIQDSDQPSCFCWIDDGSKCPNQIQMEILTMCKSYEIWRACVRKEENDFVKIPTDDDPYCREVH